MLVLLLLERRICIIRITWNHFLISVERFCTDNTIVDVKGHRECIL